MVARRSFASIKRFLQSQMALYTSAGSLQAHFHFIKLSLEFHGGLDLVFEYHSIINLYLMLSQIYKANRELFARLYPTTLVFKDGSTISIRYPEPRQIIRFPLTLEDCFTDKSKNAWQIRRRPLKSGFVEAEEDKVSFDARKYLRPKRR